MASVATGMDEPKKPQGSLPIPRSKRGLRGFFKEVGREMKKVSWPTIAETNRLTTVVLGVCLLIGGIMVVMSWLFGIFVDVLTKGRITL
jgi:preprotein translocase SecE subunit